METSYFRSSLPPVLQEQYQEQEERLFTMKLNEILQEYNNILANQLEKNRLYYEQQVQLIWESVSHPTNPNNPPNLSSTTTNTNSSNSNSTKNPLWLKQLLISLTQEKQKYSKQCELLKNKLQELKIEEEQVLLME
jgi:hypothetical protein